jgi:hypothetical protein
MSQNDQPARSLARWIGATSMVLVLVAGCVAAGSAASPTAPGGLPSPSTPAAASPQPSGSFSASGFYLRAWQTQALAPQYTFTWLPQATISDGQYIDGIVAVPAIYPGPLWVGPSVQSITARGIDAIVAEARKQGLLGSTSDFSGEPMAGAVTGNIQLIVGGTTYDMTGSPNAVAAAGATPAPGTAAAFAAFWQDITGLGMWLPDELGQSSAYEPDSLAVLAMPPTGDTSGIKPNVVPWPLATPFSKLGTAMGNDAYRCAVITGADLAKLLPVVRQSNQLTRFVDGAKVEDSLLVRVMVPGEPNPCG